MRVGFHQPHVAFKSGIGGIQPSAGTRELLPSYYHLQILQFSLYLFGIDVTMLKADMQ